MSMVKDYEKNPNSYLLGICNVCQALLALINFGEAERIIECGMLDMGWWVWLHSVLGLNKLYYLYIKFHVFLVWPAMGSPNSRFSWTVSFRIWGNESLNSWTRCSRPQTIVVSFGISFPCDTLFLRFQMVSKVRAQTRE